MSLHVKPTQNAGIIPDISHTCLQTPLLQILHFSVHPPAPLGWPTAETCGSIRVGSVLRWTRIQQHAALYSATAAFGVTSLQLIITVASLKRFAKSLQLLDELKIGLHFPPQKIFLLPTASKTAPEAHPASCPTGNGFSLLGVNATGA